MTLTQAPILKTERLILRGPEPSDFEALAAFFAENRSAGFGGPLARDEAWRWWALNIGHWHVHGYGYFTVRLKDTDAPAGLAGLWYPEGWPEPELGYVIYAAFEGKGIAYDAASCVRHWAYSVLGFTTLSSHIVPGNSRSEALALRLGAWFERSYDNPHMGEDQIFRHPGPEALT